MKLRACKDLVCKVHVCLDKDSRVILVVLGLDHICQDNVSQEHDLTRPCLSEHVCQDMFVHVYQDHVNLIQFDPIRSNLIQFEPILSDLNFQK